MNLTMMIREDLKEEVHLNKKYKGSIFSLIAEYLEKYSSPVW